MKYIWVIILTAVLFAIPAGCTALKGETEDMKGTTQSLGKKYTDISPEEAKKRLDEEKGIILLDVRTEEEYIQKHIPGSILIPVDVLEKEAPSELPDKNASIFVYCKSGRRSVAAAEMLVKLGYTHVYNLGGVVDWPYKMEAGR